MLSKDSALSPLYQDGLYNHMKQQAGPELDVVCFHSAEPLLQCCFLYAPCPELKGHVHPALSATPRPLNVLCGEFFISDKHISMGNSLKLVNIFYMYVCVYT